MEQDRFEIEVDENYEIFEALLPELLKKHPGKVALMRDREIRGFYASSAVAMAAGREQFQDGLFSIQEVTDRPVDLGFFSHVLDTRPPHITSAAD